MQSVAGSYGTLVSDIQRTADGLVSSITYGDAAGTNTTLNYNERRWLEQILTTRTPAPLWTAIPPPYTPAPEYDEEGQTSYQLTLQHYVYRYDRVGNPTLASDYRTPTNWPAGAKPVSRGMSYDDLYRLKRVDYTYPDITTDTWVSPNSADYSGSPELSDRRRGAPTAQQSFAERSKWQEYAYDWLGNTSSTADDAAGFYDRSLGTIVNDTPSLKPYQLKSATNQSSASPRSGQLSVKYDDAGNMKSLTLSRNGPYLGGSCAQRFEYAYDEVGRLIEARRWNSGADPPVGVAAVTLRYAYNAADERVLKSDVNGSGTALHTLYVFDSLELRRAAWVTAGTPDYERTSWTEVPWSFPDIPDRSLV